MDKDEGKLRNKARTLVFRLFKLRLRSEKEIRDKLRLKQFPDDIIDQTVTYFTQLGLIDDRQFARKWIASRLNRPFGARRIRHELSAKGIAREIIEETVGESQEDYDEDDIVLKLAQQRRLKYKGLDPQKVKQRLFGYLSRRGFSPGSIYKAINRL